MKRSLTPSLITEQTMNHIHSHSGRGHIKRQEIREVLENPESIRQNRRQAPADYIVKGQANNGKKLVIYVILVDDPHYYSEVCSARSV